MLSDLCEEISASVNIDTIILINKLITEDLAQDLRTAQPRSAKLLVEKNTGGPLGTVDIDFYPSTGTFKEKDKLEFSNAT